MAELENKLFVGATRRVPLRDVGDKTVGVRQHSHHILYACGILLKNDGRNIGSRSKELAYVGNARGVPHQRICGLV